MGQPHEIWQYEGVRPGIILVGVPSFGLVSIQWHSHMMQLQTPMNRSLRHMYVQGKEVGDARNEIVQRALEYQGPLGERASHVFFVDDDVLIPSHALMHLLSHNRPIVSGLYYAKTITPQPLILSHKFGGVVTDFADGALVDCDAHGMGCTLIAREVFEATEFPWFQTTKQRGPDIEGTPVYVHQTEDVWFLDKARRAGYQPCVDTSLFCPHWSNAERLWYPLDRFKAAVQAAKAQAA
jgi:hypothetical protein